jgi:putative membrane protein
METRLYKLITTPGMVLTVAMAVAMLIVAPDYLKDPWMHAKLGFVVLLIGYHHYCARLMKQMAKGEFKWSGQQLRGLNEVPTVFLVVIVLLAVFKNNFPTAPAVWGIFAMIVAMAAIIQLYARKRRLDKEKQAALNSETSEMEAGSA